MNVCQWKEGDEQTRFEDNRPCCGMEVDPESLSWFQKVPYCRGHFIVAKDKYSKGCCKCRKPTEVVHYGYPFKYFVCFCKRCEGQEKANYFDFM